MRIEEDYVEYNYLYAIAPLHRESFHFPVAFMSVGYSVDIVRFAYYFILVVLTEVVRSFGRLKKWCW